MNDDVVQTDEYGNRGPADELARLNEDIGEGGYGVVTLIGLRSGRVYQLDGPTIRNGVVIEIKHWEMRVIVWLMRFHVWRGNRLAARSPINPKEDVA